MSYRALRDKTHTLSEGEVLVFSPPNLGNGTPAWNGRLGLRITGAPLVGGNVFLTPAQAYRLADDLTRRAATIEWARVKKAQQQEVRA